jgi:hypothetical protein
MEIEEDYIWNNTEKALTGTFAPGVKLELITTYKVDQDRSGFKFIPIDTQIQINEGDRTGKLLLKTENRIIDNNDTNNDNNVNNNNVNNNSVNNNNVNDNNVNNNNVNNNNVNNNNVNNNNVNNNNVNDNNVNDNQNVLTKSDTSNDDNKSRFTQRFQKHIVEPVKRFSRRLFPKTKPK